MKKKTNKEKNEEEEEKEGRIFMMNTVELKLVIPSSVLQGANSLQYKC